MREKVLILDTSILCIWLKVPGKDTCGSGENVLTHDIVSDKINKEINTIKIEQNPNAKVEDIVYKIGYSDETSKEIRWMQNSKHLIKNDSRTQYISTYLSGNVNTIWISTDKFAVETGDITGIVFNQTIPITFNIIRFLIVTGIMIFIYMVKHVEETYNYKNVKQEIILIVLLLFTVLICNAIN